MLQKTTKQKFEYFLETHADESTFFVQKTDSFIQYNWIKRDVIIASQTNYKGVTRVVYEVKI